jgi:hypothetical protein
LSTVHAKKEPIDSQGKAVHKNFDFVKSAAQRYGKIYSSFCLAKIKSQI